MKEIEPLLDMEPGLGDEEYELGGVLLGGGPAEIPIKMGLETTRDG